MRCAKCGNPIDDNADYCTFCGEKINFTQKKVSTGLSAWQGGGTDVLPGISHMSRPDTSILSCAPSQAAGDGASSHRGAADDSWAGDYEAYRTEAARADVARDQRRAASQTIAIAQATPSAASEGKKGPDKLKVAIAATAIVGVVGLGVGIAFANGLKSDASQTQSAASTAVVASSESTSTGKASSAQGLVTESEREGDAAASASSSASTATSEDSGSGTSSSGSQGGTGTYGAGISSGSGLSDSDAYKALLGYYDDCSDYDTRIASAATTFNNNALSDTATTRKSDAKNALLLKTEISNARDEINDLDMPFWSVNYDAWGDICKLYDYLYNRIDVIERAWEISLKYDKPSEHSSEILAPISSTKNSSGTSKDLVAYRALYPTITLVKP